MADWYDKAISALGLDGSRTDRLFGSTERELTVLDAPRWKSPVRVTLNRLADGRRLLLFQVGPASEGENWPLPCSHVNAEALGIFFRRAEDHLRPDGVSEGSTRNVIGRLGEWLKGGRLVEAMAPLAHRHLDCTVDLRLLANRRGGPTLVWGMTTPSSRFFYSWRWTRPLAADWQRILAAVQTDATDWACKGV